MADDVKDEELYPFGWAPGGYTINCVDCPGGKAPMGRWGAKRSIRCRPHAVEELRKIQARVHALTTRKPNPAPAAGAQNTPVDGEALLALCRKFIKDQRITCPETIAQTDRVIVNAYDFIEGICDIVGYHEDDD
jgi:hypothetical protein